MIAILLIALLATAALASALVLADSAVRGRNAFRQLRGRLAPLDGERRVTVRFDDARAGPAFPARRRRSVSPARPARRPAWSPAPSLPAVA